MVTVGKVRLLIAHSREVIRSGLVKCIEAMVNMEIVAVCNCSELTIQHAIKLKPDVILLDANIIGDDCIEVTRRIREFHPEMRIIIVTPLLPLYHDPSFYINLEANGYVDLDIDGLHLSETISRVNKGDYVISPMIFEKFNENFTPSDTRSNTKQDTSLTKREEEVLALLAQGLSNKEIANNLFITVNTTKAHLHSIMRKLKVRTRSQAAILARDKVTIPSKTS